MTAAGTLRGWAYSLGLIRYCIQCDGSTNEERARGRRFRADRWILHRQHERWPAKNGQAQGPMRTDLPRTGGSR